jgi:AcrR family transcriptional regulator
MASTKRDQLIDTALRLFYENGFHATGIDKVLAESGCAKMTLYKHFKSKDELILAVIRRMDETMRNDFMREIERRAKTPRDRLVALFDVLEGWFKDPEFKGCLFVHASGEFPDEDHPVLNACAEHQRLIHNYIHEQATAAGSTDPNGLADELMLLVEGAVVRSHILHDPTVAQDAKRAAAKLVDHALAN